MSILLNPAFALVCYALAIGTALLLVRHSPVGGLLDSSADRRSSIDGLRGYLAFGVVIHHIVIYYPYLRDGTFDLPDSNLYSQLGRASVAFFFMITSFLFWTKLLETQGRMDWKRFAITRLARIYPLYLMVLTLVLLIVFQSTDWQLRTASSELTASLLGWLTFHRPALNGVAAPGNLIANVTWTLSYEFFFYIALPAFGMIFLRHTGYMKTLVGLLVVFALYKAFGGSSVLKHSILAAFLGGVAAAYWVRHPRCRAISQGRKAAGLAILLLSYALLASKSTFSPLTLVPLTIVFCIIAAGNDLFGALRPRALRWLGDISYSTYLLHGLLLWFGLVGLPPLLGLDPTTPGYFLGFSLLMVVALVPLSSLTYLLVERPGIAWGKRLGKPSRGAASLSR